MYGYRINATVLGSKGAKQDEVAASEEAQPEELVSSDIVGQPDA